MGRATRPGRRERLATFRQDATAGAVLGVESVPDGLATGLLAGVNPLAGVHGYMIGTVAGALATSSAFMAVQGTGAMAIIVADVPEVHDGLDPDRALFTLAMVTGVVMVVAGALRLGGVLRFVSNAVLVGQSNAVRIRQRLFTDDGPVETDPPAELGADQVVVLQPYGSLFFAAAPVFEAALPRVTPRSRNSVVLLRLRERTDLGTTFTDVLQRYAQALSAVGSKLVIVSVNERLADQLRVTGLTDLIGEANLYRGSERIGAALDRAHRDALAWVASHNQSDDDEDH